MSKSFTPAERNYEIYDRELLAIMTALENWRHYLMGAKHKFEIWTDHANLQYFKKAQKLNRRQARWLTELQEYDFTLHHLPGKANSKADILSRRPGFNKGEDDNEDTILLPESLFFTANSLFIASIVQIEPTPFIPRILRNSQNLDKSVKDALEKHSPEFKTEEDGTLTYHDLIYVPLDKDLRADIISYHHDTRLSGHYGENKTIELIRRRYWWPTLRWDVKLYIRGCEACQWTKSKRIPQKTPLHPFEPPTQIIRDRVVRDHGLPRKIIHDRDTRFMSKYTKDLLKLLDIKQNPSTAYHPQTDGQTERMNQTVEQYL
jgi:hypothetical protein